MRVTGRRMGLKTGTKRIRVKTRSLIKIRDNVLMHLQKDLSATLEPPLSVEMNCCSFALRSSLLLVDPFQAQVEPSCTDLLLQMQDANVCPNTDVEIAKNK